MAFYKQDIVDVNLETGVIHRSFLNHTIGHKDDDADRFGVRVFRNGTAEDLTGVSCQAIFMAPDGTNIALTSHGTVSENVAYVTLPQACYNVEGQFCLAIKLVGGGVTATVRIIDGVVDRTGATGAVAPTEAVPTYQEILAVYAEMQEDIADYESVVANQNDQINSLKSAFNANVRDINRLYFLSGTIDSSGNYQTNNTRCADIYYYDVESFDQIMALSTVEINFFCYDEDFTFIPNSSGWLTAGTVITKSTITTLHNNAKYVRFAFRKTSGTTISDVDEFYSRITFGKYSFVNENIKKIEAINSEIATINSEIATINAIGLPNISRVVKQNGDFIKKYFILGTLSSTTGEYSNNSTRATIDYFFDIDLFNSIEILSTAKLNYFGYTASKQFISSSGFLTAGTGVTKSQITTAIQNVKYVKFAFAKSSDGTISDLDEFYSRITFNQYYYNYDMLDDIAELQSHFPKKTHKYYGELIQFDHSFDYNYIMTIDGGQGGAIYGNTLFAFDSDATANIYDMTTKSLVGSLTLDQAATITPHCNSVCFGNEFYDQSDQFPLLYVNAYNATGLPRGTCYVHRIIVSNGSYSTSLVQTISIGFTSDSEWTDGSDVRPYGNFCVDTDRNLLYVYTLLDTTNVTRFFAFELPTLSDGSTVTLDKVDIVSKFDCEYCPYIQDNAYYNGKLYLCTGYGNFEYNGFIRVIDLINQKMVSIINLNESGVAIGYEPEIIIIYKNTIYYGTGTNIFNFVF